VWQVIPEWDLMDLGVVPYIALTLRGKCFILRGIFYVFCFTQQIQECRILFGEALRLLLLPTFLI
jgi:hypothetical protein